MTAVEWFKTELEKMQYFIGNDMLEAYNQAIEMEKQQIEDAFNAGVNSEDFFCPPFEISESETYYNETYKPSA